MFGNARRRWRVESTIAGKRPRFESFRPSGRRWIAEASGAPIHDTHGNVIGGVAVTLDITERKRVEEALRRSERLEREQEEVARLNAKMIEAREGALTDCKGAP